VSTLRITSEARTMAKIELDGTDVSNAVKGLTLTMKPGQLPTAVLEIPVVDLSSEPGEANVHISDATRDLLVQIGWTPPTEGG
jgi:hypothetical protein